MDGIEFFCYTKNGSLFWVDGTFCGFGYFCWDGSCLFEEEVERFKVRDSYLGGWGKRVGGGLFLRRILRSRFINLKIWS